MEINTYRKRILTLAISLCTTSANATTSYSSEGHLSLEVIGFADDSGNNYDFDNQSAVIALLNSDNSDDKEYSTSTTGDAFAEGVATPFSDSGLIELDAQASGYAGSAYVYAQSDATASANFGFENTSVTEDYSIDLLLSYSFSCEVETYNPADQQNGKATIDIDLFGDYNLGPILAISKETELGLESFSVSENKMQINFF